MQILAEPGFLVTTWTVRLPQHRCYRLFTASQGMPR